MRIHMEVLGRILPGLLLSETLSSSTLGLDAVGARQTPRRPSGASQPPLAPRLTLRPGQVLLGRILRLIEGGAILDLGGTRVRASLLASMRLAVDAELWLQVEGAPRQGMPALRVLGEVKHAAPTERGGRRAQGDLIHALLRAHRLPVNPTSRALAGEILRLGLPFSADAFASLVEIATSLNGQRLFPAEATLRASLLTQDRGLPPTEQVVRSLGRVLGGPALVDLVESLARDVRRALSSDLAPADSKPGTTTTMSTGTDATTPVSIAQSSLRPILQRLLRLLDALSQQMRQMMPMPTSGTHSSEASGQPAANGRTPGVDATLSTPSTPTPTHSASTPGVTLDRVIQQLGLDHEFQLTRMAASSNLTATQATRHGAAALLGEDARADLKASLLGLAQHEGLPGGLRARMGALLDHLTGRQLLMRPQTGEPLSSVMIPLPLGDGGHQQWLTIWGRFRSQDSGSDSQSDTSDGLDLQNCRILFDLQLPSLGPTVVDVHIVNRALQVQVMTAHPEVEDLIQPQRRELAQSLSEFGFHLSGLETGPLPPRAAPNKAQSHDATSEPFPPIALSPHSGGVNLQI